MIALFTGANRYTEPQLAALRALGLTPVWMQEESAALPAQAKDAEAVVCNGLFLHHDLAEFPRLRFVQLTSAGLDRAPVSALQKKGIALYNARGVYSIPSSRFGAFCPSISTRTFLLPIRKRTPGKRTVRFWSLRERPC